MKDSFHFHCPNCSAPLRVKDPLSLGRQTHCPDCRHPLLIVDDNGTPRISLGALEPEPAIVPPPVAAVPTALLEKLSEAEARVKPVLPMSEVVAKPEGRTKPSHRPRGIRKPPRSAFWSSKPLIVGWLLVGILATVFVGFAIRGDRRVAPEGEPSATADVPESKAPVGEAPSGTDDDEAEAVSLTEQSLQEISELLQRQLALEGAFPAGTVEAEGLAVDQRLSWMAVLADRMAPHHPVTWEKPWTDPLNDGFVRRRILEFQNPAISVLTGTDGYPATHYVGVGGVGPDATRLDVSDPRAGAFSNERRTRLEDIRDGASNTWLVLGVQERLGSWAAGGNATVRPLVHEPYVNGRDGFGTGQPDSMLVLLADGRVQSVSATADPSVLRALATIADGLPASEDESGDRTVVNVEIVSTAEGDDGDEMEPPEDDRPLEPDFAPEPAIRHVDPAIALRQPIVRFELSPARPLAELLPGLAELVGVPLRIEPDGGVTSSSLRTPIQLRLQETTIGAILDGALKPAGLTYKVESDHLRIVPRE